MSKHHVRNDFEMGRRLEILRAKMAEDTGIKPTQGDLLCMAVIRLMDEKGVKYEKAKDPTGDPFIDCWEG